MLSINKRYLGGVCLLFLPAQVTDRDESYTLPYSRKQHTVVTIYNCA